MSGPKPFASASFVTVEGAILDLDGTLIREGERLRGAGRLLKHFAGRFVVATNNSSDTAETLSARLAHQGLKIEPKSLLLAGEEALRLISARYPGVHLLLLAAPALHECARSLGLSPDGQDGEVVLLCRDPDFSYDKLRIVANLLRQGVPFYVANSDLTHPGAKGKQVPETGALLAAVIACSGDAIPKIIGKPNSHLYLQALSRLSIQPHQAVVIGDNPDTDIAGARAQGIRTLLIGSHADAVACDPADLLKLLKPKNA